MKHPPSQHLQAQLFDGRPLILQVELSRSSPHRFREIRLVGQTGPGYGLEVPVGNLMLGSSLAGGLQLLQAFPGDLGCRLVGLL